MNTYSDRLDRAHAAGEAAAQAGLPRDFNPYLIAEPALLDDQAPLAQAWDYSWYAHRCGVAVREGRMARLCGEPRDQCPYGATSGLDGAWLHGWDLRS